MNEKGFSLYLGNGKSEKTIQSSIAIVKEVEVFLKDNFMIQDFSQTHISDFRGVVQYLFENNKNTWENYLALLRYSRFICNQELEITILELLDGSDVLKNLSNKVKKIVGEKKHQEIFEGIDLPPLGTFPIEKSKITQKFMERLDGFLGQEDSKEVLLSGPHNAPKENYLSERSAFVNSEGIDDFLQKRHEKYVRELESHMTGHSLYFTQEIDEDVLDYVRNTPTCQNGFREGNIIYVTKIPYMTKRFLKEKDERMKRYYSCHCPWVREAIKSGTSISSNFCYCSASFEKQPWEVIFDQPIKVEVLETVLNGDLICRFAIHIPDKYFKTTPCNKRRCE